MTARKSHRVRPRWIRARRAWGWFLLSAAALVLVAVRYRLVVVVGDSMRPGWKSGDLVAIDRWAYAHRAPAEGEVVVARLGSELILKRIIGLPGQTVELKEGLVWVDGVARQPGYPVVPGALEILRGTLGGDKYAILGDNRALQAYPTLHAVVSRTEIVGQAVATWRWWPGPGREFSRPAP